MSDIRENIEKFVNAVKDGNYNEAQNVFSGLVGDKLEDRLEAEKIAVAGSIFNDEDEDLLVDEIEEGKKYKKEEEDDEDDESEEEDDDDEEDDEDEEEELKEKKPKKKHGGDVKEGTMAVGIFSRDSKKAAEAKKELKDMLKKHGNKKVGSKEGREFFKALDNNILSDDDLADHVRDPSYKNYKISALLKLHSERPEMKKLKDVL